MVEMSGWEFVAKGNVTVEASGAGVVASKEVTVSGMTSDDAVMLTISNTSIQNLRNAVWLYGFQVVKDSGKFTIYANGPELPNDVKVDYIVVREIEF